MDAIEEHILEIAKSFATDKSWPWIEPVELRLTFMPSGEKAWSVRTNILNRGRNVRLLVRESDFSVLDFAYLPR